ncbi:T9SS type A sorting domain-containing protein [Brumimicrobium glaciale]|uniref:T9SS type A sorting domain-containing protein n=1 Tax=Brumimicrobium glaciale TaxID=200475 RepID=A0A4Q4KPR3_9FLAO|nr:T9SS type A sorting domain-containing protein [Brumimicrobium glaciale]RYM33999.1 T9SS type A sorting domain-containing protein [Brumimicrobium glaciale]
MKKLVTIITSFVVTVGFSQTTIIKSSLDSGGASVINGTKTVIYTLGEVAVQETTIGNIHISEGFLGPNIIGTSDLDNYSPLEGLNIYPNPTTNFVNIDFKKSDIYEISLYNINGKQVFTIKTDQTNTQRLNLENYNNGTYLLVVKNNNEQSFKTFRIIKK